MKTLSNIECKMIAVFAAFFFCFSMILIGCEEEPDDNSPKNRPPTIGSDLSVSGTGVSVSGGVPTVSLKNIKDGTAVIILGGGTPFEDPDGDTLTYAWSPVNTPSVATITNENAASTNITNVKKAGDYTYKLTVSDGNGGTAAKKVTFKVEGYQAEKDVDVSFPAFASGTTLSFAPTYTPNGNDWGEFSASEITYTVTVEGTGVNRTYDNTSGFVANISDGYQNFNTYTFTQVFKLNGEEIGCQIIKAAVMFDNFAGLTDTEDSPITAIPLIVLDTLTKPISVLP